MSRRSIIRFAPALLAALAASAQAATFTVTTTADSGAGSLRQAIVDANTAPSDDRIEFAIPGNGPHRIELASNLPNIVGTLVIDGYTQPGSAPNTLAPDEGGLDTVLAVEVTAVNFGNLDGFRMQSGTQLTVQGLALNRFSMAIRGHDASVSSSRLFVYGSFIGTTPDGGSAEGAGNRDCAVRTFSSETTIGGTLPWQRNLLSGNGCGVMVSGPAVIQGNLIGTDASGTQAIANGQPGNWAGLIVGARRNVLVGGASAAARNVISGNVPWGISIWPNFGGAAGAGAIADFAIIGNYIGSDWTGAQPLPNGFPGTAPTQYGGGIQLQGNGSDQAYPIGGFGVGEANLIAWNRGTGIICAGGNVCYFDNRGNVIHQNRGLGFVNVDVGAVGPSANDPGDVDEGYNRGQNYPEVLSVTSNGTQLNVTYRVDTAPASATWPLRIDFYEGLADGVGDWIGQDSYPESSAQAERSIVIPLPEGVSGLPLVATATDAKGYSSEIPPRPPHIFSDGFEEP